jgi:hypothetical protein
MYYYAVALFARWGCRTWLFYQLSTSPHLPSITCHLSLTSFQILTLAQEPANIPRRLRHLPPTSQRKCGHTVSKPVVPYCGPPHRPPLCEQTGKRGQGCTTVTPARLQIGEGSATWVWGMIRCLGWDGDGRHRESEIVDRSI